MAMTDDAEYRSCETCGDAVGTRGKRYCSKTCYYNRRTPVVDLDRGQLSFLRLTEELRRRGVLNTPAGDLIQEARTRMIHAENTADWQKASHEYRQYWSQLPDPDEDADDLQGRIMEVLGAED